MFFFHSFNLCFLVIFVGGGHIKGGPTIIKLLSRGEQNGAASQKTSNELVFEIKIGMSKRFLLCVIFAQIREVSIFLNYVYL